MKAEKKFDCVEMKAQIQERLLGEIAELGETGGPKAANELVFRDPILGDFLRMKMLQQTATEHTPSA